MTSPLHTPAFEVAMTAPAPLTAAEARALVEAAAERLTKCWPLRTYIACNPLLGYEDKPFFAAMRAAQQDGIWVAGPSPRVFAPHFKNGQIDRALLYSRFLQRLRQLAGEVPALPLQRELLWADLLADLLPTPQETPSPELLAACERLCRTSGLPVVAALPPAAGQNQRIDAATAVWCAAYLDEGQAVWSLPGREEGLLAAWRTLASHDPALTRKERKALAALLAGLPQDRHTALADLLNRAEQPPLEQLLSHMTRVPGWVGYLRWKANHPDAREIDGARHALADLMVIRLCYGAVLQGTAPEPAAPATPESGVLATRLSRAAAALTLPESDLLEALTEHGPALFTALSVFDPVTRVQILTEALEDSQRQPLLGDLARQARLAPVSPTRRLLAQAVFCIDVRSEPYRRQLEQHAPAGRTIETLGFAGFFGIPMRLRPLGGGAAQDLCPVLLHPRYEIEEEPHGCTPRQARRAQGRQRTLAHLGKMLSDLKAGVAATFGMVETTGLAYGIAAVGKTLLPQGFHRLTTALRQQVAPVLPTRLVLSGCGHTVTSGLAHGLTDAEQAFFAETALRMMGLVEGFAPLVLLCGHGSQTENNPYAAALDCGACGGNHGGANARVLAAILNTPAVRAALAERGIQIPDETRFLSAGHNTTTDTVTVDPDADLSPVHGAELALLQQALRAATDANRTIRQARLPGQDDSLRNAVNWSQVRPEWGLAGNAFFIVGPRRLTERLDLGGRAFLHSYDHTVDPEGKAMEVILTAPLVVAEWINTQYLFSTLDNDRFGSGTKVTHNVVGKFGILQGNSGDLQVGLPLQSVMQAEGQPYHLPVRLMAVVVAPRATVTRLVARHTVLQQFFHNGWVALTVIEPETGSLLEYKGHDVWEHVASEPAALQDAFAPLPA